MSDDHKISPQGLENYQVKTQVLLWEHYLKKLSV